MNEIERMFAKENIIDESLKRAVCRAVLAHARLGHSVPEAHNGQVVWVPPAEILTRFEPTEATRVASA